MKRERPAELRSWMPFTLPAAIALPIVTGFLLAGPVLGFLVAGLVAVAVVFVAIRMEPRSSRRHAASDDAGDHAVRRAATRRFAVPLVIAAVGIALILAATGTVRIVGWGVLAIAITLAISLVFLEVGYSEDRARARHRRSARRAASEDRGRGTPRGIRG